MEYLIKILKKIKSFSASVILPWAVDAVISFCPDSDRASRWIDRLILLSEGDRR